MTSHFQEIETATDAELADACAKLVLAFAIPLDPDDVADIQDIVTTFEESGSMLPENRQTLIRILQNTLAPHAN